ncbi:hypothetical protein M0812_21869 [Anaeramoeba flamelloides]|uniref:Sec23/Sec24 trunk domain-containing protein n=1 Tax=Anaeramoeba flamelloides TaxID=1746091 RepID=A0AAV7YT10_9EUKA|nr:hypothetical protein M0812_21869 [Anaeramoeba flamelloides]
MELATKAIYIPKKHLVQKRKETKKSGSESFEDSDEELAQSTNVISIDLGTIKKRALEVSNVNKFCSCSKCEAALNKFSIKLTKEEYLKQQKEEKEKEKEKENENEKEKEDENEKETEKDSDLEDDDLEDEEETLFNEETIPNGSILWKCEFCGNINLFKDADKVKIPTEQEVDYLVNEQEEKQENVSDESVIVFCIDKSGSMSITSKLEGNKLSQKKLKKMFKQDYSAFGGGGYGQQNQEISWVSRLQCLKIAVGNQIEELSRQYPDRKVVLVTFSNEVTVYGSGMNESLVVKDQDLDNEEELINLGTNFELPPPVKESGRSMIKKVYSLNENGQTALGPAVALSIAIASQKVGSKVILCTDGQSNIGIGSLEVEGEKLEQTDQFYSRMGEMCTNSGVIFDIITIRDTDCNLEKIGTISTQSGGDTLILKPVELADRFKNIMSNSVIATSVNIQVILHKCLFVYDEDDRKVGTRLEQEIGNVTEDHELSFNYGIKEFGADDIEEAKKNQKNLYFQLQIRYTSLNGGKWNRTVTKKLSTTQDIGEALNEIDYDLWNQNVVQRGATYAIKGDLKKSKNILRSHGRRFKKLLKKNKDKNKKSKKGKMARMEFGKQKRVLRKVMRQELSSSSSSLSSEEFSSNSSSMESTDDEEGSSTNSEIESTKKEKVKKKKKEKKFSVSFLKRQRLKKREKEKIKDKKEREKRKKSGRRVDTTSKILFRAKKFSKKKKKVLTSSSDEELEREDRKKYVKKKRAITSSSEDSSESVSDSDTASSDISD